MFERRDFLAMALSLPLLPATADATSPAQPLLQRLRVATVAVADIGTSEALYRDYLGYSVSESGRVDKALAASWGAPKTADRRYALMRSAAEADVFVRLVEAKPVPGYRAMTTHGWNAIEIVVEDVVALYEKLKDSSFTILDSPKPLNGYPSIVAMQVKGPSEEVFYLTTETGNAAASALPLPGAFVGRPFIMVVAGSDADTMLDWYAAHFAMVRRRVMSTPIDILQQAQGLAPGHEFTMATMALARRGNLIEFNAYPASAGARVHPAGELPPGIAMTSFAVSDLHSIDLPFIASPVARKGLAYGGRRAATVIGPSGELMELIEE